ncbi:MAG TPA: squalene/phytoene synthase family protein [Candidatus Sulfotelmatobacter sp.]|nr:squalene/phytoene synthase family protein [Candidatus Sulfotelmatobacter sp.]
MPQARLPYCAEQVRRYDHARFLTALFAPEARRDDLFALYAFNLEIAKVRETVREPMLGRIRLQWWRETIEGFEHGEVRAHAVATPLAETIQRRRLAAARFATLITGREQDVEPDPPADLAALEDYAAQTSATLVELALDVLDGGHPSARAAARHVGIAHGLAGLLLAVPFRAAHGRVDLPQDLLDEAGLHSGAVKEARGDPRLVKIVRVLALRAADHLDKARTHRRQVPREALPALLPALLAERALKRLAAAGHDPFDAALGRPDGGLSLRLAWAAWRGRY